MNNGDFIRNLNNKELARFLAEERYRMAKPIFDHVGYGITKKFVMSLLLKWLDQEVAMDG